MPARRSPIFIDKCAALWDLNYSVSEIARMMGVSKNVIHGISFKNRTATKFKRRVPGRKAQSND